MFKQRLSPVKVRTISRREMVGGLLLVATPLPWVLASGSSRDARAAPALPTATEGWTTTGSLQQARDAHTATLLANGRVLVAGGSPLSGELASAELYDPNSGTWTATGSMHLARFGQTATLLANGRVLVACGDGIGNAALASAELYDAGGQGPGAQRDRCSRRALSTRRRCCPMGRCWWLAVTTGKRGSRSQRSSIRRRRLL